MFQTEKSKCKNSKAGSVGHIQRPARKPVCVEPRQIVEDNIRELARDQIMLAFMGHDFTGFYSE